MTGRNLKFTYSDYEEFLRSAMELAPITTLGSWKGENCVILRHDVDFDLASARKLADVEKRLGVRSTFFIMASNQFYNLLFPGSSEILKSMAGDGFEIGLHFDPSIYGDIGKDELDERMRQECEILQRASGMPVRSVSLHNPSISGQYPMFDGFVNAYSKEIFSDENYMSDSCMDFRGKDPYEFVRKARTMPVQIVFHPMHWSEDGQDYIGFFSGFVNGLVDNIDRTFMANRTYKKVIGQDRLRDKMRGA